MEQITGNVFYENKVRGCNPGYVVTSVGIVLIDFPVDFEFAKQWMREVAKRGKIRCLINTEHHMDHWLCDGLFEGDIIAHEATRETMRTMDLDFIRKRTKVLYIDPLVIPEGYQLRYPNITYHGGMTLYFGKHTFHLIHTPGHTPGPRQVCEEWTLTVRVRKFPVLLSQIPCSSDENSLFQNR